MAQAGESDGKVIQRLNDNEGAFARLTPDAVASQLPRLQVRGSLAEGVEREVVVGGSLAEGAEGGGLVMCAGCGASWPIGQLHAKCQPGRQL